MFKHFKKQMQESFANMVKDQTTLHVTGVDKQLIWDTYINAFPEDQRQEHVCNSCRSFLRQFGNIVSIKNGEVKTLWDFDGVEPFDNVVKALRNLVLRADITSTYINNFAKLGTDKNAALGEDGKAITWEHLSVTLPAALVNKSSSSNESVVGTMNSTKDVFKRSLEELTLDSLETVLELIAQGSLYRGDEQKFMLDQFIPIKKAYDKLKNVVQKDLYAWENAQKYAGSVARIRNTALGTLLQDISAGEDLDKAVGAFERIMAPANYKRPKPIVSKRQIEDAEKRINELGLAGSLGRRFATPEDIAVPNLLFVNRNSRKAKLNQSIFAQLKDEADVVNPKSLERVEEVPISKFLTDILPTVKAIEILPENGHAPNFVSLITAQDADAPSLFKWDNAFSWSYMNSLADSDIKAKVKAAGGKVDGFARASLSWKNYDDLDLHMEEPGGSHIYYATHRKGSFNGASPAGGLLDVDMNAGSGSSRTPVENIIYENGTKMKKGKYKVYVNQFTQREKKDVGFEVEMDLNGEVFNFAYDKEVRGNVPVAEFEFTGNGFKMLTNLDSKISSKKIWGVDTNKFQPVSMIMNSPNYWGDKGVGNKHVFFILENAHNEDSLVRGFFNEFLKTELDQDRKVFEVLGSKLNVAPADKQLSGIGFSTTTRGAIICKVEGKFSRTLKIIF